MGKASLALDITRHVAVELHKPFGVFSLEMRADELGLKLLSAESDIADRCARAGQLSSQHWRDLYTAVRRIAGARLYLDDSTGPVLRDLEARSWWLKAQHPDPPFWSCTTCSSSRPASRSRSTGWRSP